MMKCIKIFCICFITASVRTDGNYYRAKDMCEESSKDSNQTYKDCSFQIKSAEESSCKIYNTEACKTFDFSNWTSEPIKHISSQTDASFTALVESYLLKFPVSPKGPFDAFNITLSSTTKDVNGFLVQVTPNFQSLLTDYVHLNICRILDFRKYSVGNRNKVSLFFDCIYLALENEIKIFNFTLRAFPMNEELQYGVVLPDKNEIESNNLCQWTPLVMVFFGKLEKNVVEIKFLEAPKIHNILRYQVDLISNKENNQVKYSEHIQAKNKDEVLEISFSSVDQGLYSVAIHLITNNERYICHQNKRKIFFVHVPNKLSEPVLLIYLLIISLITIGLIVGILILRWFLKPNPVISKPIVLFVYSYDCKQHEEVVSRFAMFLKKKCGIKVNSIYGSGNEDPNKWLVKNYLEADAILIVISKGVFEKCEGFNDPPMKEGHTWGDRLNPALSFLSSELLSTKNNIPKKKCIKVYFEYSGPHHIPKCLQLVTYGKTFKLLSDLNRFLCHVYNQPSKIKCFGIYPQMFGHVISSPEGLALIESIEKMKSFQKQNSVCPEVPDNIQCFENEIPVLTDERKCIGQGILPKSEINNVLFPLNSHEIISWESSKGNGKCINDRVYWEDILNKELLSPDSHEDQNLYKDELIVELHQQLFNSSSGHDSVVNENNTLPINSENYSTLNKSYTVSGNL